MVAEVPRAGADEVECDCACLAHFLAAALVCQPHEHGLFTEGWKNDPCRHFFIAAIASRTSLFDGLWPLPLNAGRPSARSISCSEYCPMPRKWWDFFDISAEQASRKTALRSRTKKISHLPLELARVNTWPRLPQLSLPTT